MREVKQPKQPISSNIVDKVITYFNPKAGFERVQARKMLALTGGYHGGSRLRTAIKNFLPGSGSADADINPDLPELRGRVRDLARNAPVATAAIGTNVTNVIGTGLTLRPSIDHKGLGLTEKEAEKWEENTRREWDLWANSRFCDVTGKQNFAGLQALAFRSMLESGDVFALTPMIKRHNFPYELSLQLIEADRVSNPNRRVDSDTISGGIKLDQYGKATAVYVSNIHPGSLRQTGMTWKPVSVEGGNGRKNVIHLFDQLRPGQVRGVPLLAPIIEQLKQVSNYTDSALAGAVIRSTFAVFMRMDPEAFAGLFEDENRDAYIKQGMEWNGDISSSKVVNLLPGEEPVTIGADGQFSEFDPVMTSILRQIGMAIEMPYEVLVMHFSSSYSAARGALLQAWRVFSKRRSLFVDDFCQVTYELWLHEAIASGRIAAPGFFVDAMTRASWSKAQWTGDGPGVLDEKKSAEGAKLRMDMGLTTLEQETMQHNGGDWYSNHRQSVKEKEARVEGGLVDPADQGEVVETPDEDDDDENNMSGKGGEEND